MHTIEENKVQIDLICQFLHKILIDETVLYHKTKNAYWNYECNNFFTKNKLFEIQYLELNNFIERLARTSIALGRKIPYHCNDVALLIKPLKKNFQNKSLIDVRKELIIDHLALIKIIENCIDYTSNSLNFGTQQLFQNIISKHNELINQLS
jgi:starvation-inducible DNA-binding protein